MAIELKISEIKRQLPKGMNWSMLTIRQRLLVATVILRERADELSEFYADNLDRNVSGFKDFVIIDDTST